MKAEKTNDKEAKRHWKGTGESETWKREGM